MNLQSMRKTGLLIFVTVHLLTAACGLSAKQQAANAALDALQKINAALKVRVSYQDYGHLVTEAQAQVDKASSLLPDGELKNELNAAMEGYRDAKWAWDLSRQAPASNGPDSLILVAESQDMKTLSFDRPNGTKAKELMKKYSVISGTESNVDMMLISTDDLLQAIWKTAGKHVERAKSLSS